MPLEDLSGWNVSVRTEGKGFLCCVCCVVLPSCCNPALLLVFSKHSCTACRVAPLTLIFDTPQPDKPVTFCDRRSPHLFHTLAHQPTNTATTAAQPVVWPRHLCRGSRQLSHHLGGGNKRGAGLREERQEELSTARQGAGRCTVCVVCLCVRMMALECVRGRHWCVGHDRECVCIVGRCPADPAHPAAAVVFVSPAPTHLYHTTTTQTQHSARRLRTRTRTRLHAAWASPSSSQVCCGGEVRQGLGFKGFIQTPKPCCV